MRMICRPFKSAYWLLEISERISKVKDIIKKNEKQLGVKET